MPLVRFGRVSCRTTVIEEPQSNIDGEYFRVRGTNTKANVHDNPENTIDIEDAATASSTTDINDARYQFGVSITTRKGDRGIAVKDFADWLVSCNERKVASM